MAPNRWPRGDTHNFQGHARRERMLTDTPHIHTQHMHQSMHLQQRTETTACNTGGSWYGGRTQPCSTCSVALGQQDNVVSKSYFAKQLKASDNAEKQISSEDKSPVRSPVSATNKQMGEVRGDKFSVLLGQGVWVAVIFDQQLEGPRTGARAGIHRGCLCACCSCDTLEQ